MSLLVGAIADDITGATDLGLMLSANGMPTTLFLGIPPASMRVSTPAMVIALKTRTATAPKAVAQSKAAAQFYLARDVRQLFFKYCSTFDSTAAGNIGPVSRALLDLVGQDQTVLLPAFPENGRTVLDGVLMVDGMPLAESSMRDHPLTPMRESSLVDLMDAQTEPGSTAVIDSRRVDQGAEVVREQLQVINGSAQVNGRVSYVAIDTRDNDDLATIAAACHDMKVITGGSGIAAALPSVLREQGLLPKFDAQTELPAVAGNAVVLAGSCSAATRGQVEAFQEKASSIELDPLEIANDPAVATRLAQEAATAVQSGNVIVHSTTAPNGLKHVQQQIGVAESAELVERTLAKIATTLFDAGIRKFVVAGGETSGAVANALSIRHLLVGPRIEPGIPWMSTPDESPVCLAFKSGNFGSVDFFERALGMLP